MLRNAVLAPMPMVAATPITIAVVVPLLLVALEAALLAVLKAVVDLVAKPTSPRTPDAVETSRREAANPVAAQAPSLPRDAAKAKPCEIDTSAEILHKFYPQHTSPIWPAVSFLVWAYLSVLQSGGVSTLSASLPRRPWKSLSDVLCTFTRFQQCLRIASFGDSDWAQKASRILLPFLYSSEETCRGADSDSDSEEVRVAGPGKCRPFEPGSCNSIPMYVVHADILSGI